MGAMKNMQIAFAEEYIREGYTTDMDVAVLWVNELWDDAMIHHKKRSINKLNKLVRRYERGEL
jgi:hypothetical protein